MEDVPSEYPHGDGRLGLARSCPWQKVVAVCGFRSWCRSRRLTSTLIMTAKLNNIDPQAWLAYVLARIADTPITELEQLLPWNWTPKTLNAQAA